MSQQQAASPLLQPSPLPGAKKTKAPSAAKVKASTVDAAKGGGSGGHGNATHSGGSGGSGGTHAKGFRGHGSLIAVLGLCFLALAIPIGTSAALIVRSRRRDAAAAAAGGNEEEGYPQGYGGMQKLSQSED